MIYFNLKTLKCNATYYLKDFVCNFLDNPEVDKTLISVLCTIFLLIGGVTYMLFESERLNGY